MLFDAHNHAFRVLGGVPRRGIYDNMRTAVRSDRARLSMAPEISPVMAPENSPAGGFGDQPYA